MTKRISAYEQETIINFNKAEDTAIIFTYEKKWQEHLESRLGLKPIRNNGVGGKEYELPKSRIRPPRAARRLSDSAKKKLAERLHRNRTGLRQGPIAVGN
jgi:hypothetical protein